MRMTRKTAPPATGWTCDECGAPAVVHLATGGGGHAWACARHEHVLDQADVVFRDSTPGACPWPETHRRLHPVAVLNTSIATEDGTYTLRTVSAAQARELLDGREILSAVGHEATAQALSEVLGREIPVNRIQFAQQPGQVALVFKLRGRAPEGAILDRTQVEAIGYDLKVLERTS